MPLYIFQHPVTEEIKEIVQKMNDPHVYEEDGIKWQRLFTKPTAAVSSISSIDPNDARQFTNVTGTKKGTLGDIQDLSKELSEKREAKEGKDSIKEKFYDNYAKTRNGKRHLNEKKEKLKKELKNNKMFDVDI